MDAGIDEFVEAIMMLSIESLSTFHSPMNVLSGCQNSSRMDGSFNCITEGLSYFWSVNTSFECYKSKKFKKTFLC